METVTETVTREVPSHIADLVYFGRRVAAAMGGGAEIGDVVLIAMARDFWEMNHGEDS